MITHEEDDELPDAGEGMCCMGAAAMGPGRCTCWEAEYDRPQSEDLQQGPMSVRGRSCHDCAFRPGSPEQQGDSRYALEEVASGAVPFLRHRL